MLEIDEKDLRSGVLGLVVALVEIIKETLELQALKRMEKGTLAETQVERLGAALMDLEGVIDKIKVELGVSESVKAVRDGLDEAVEGIVNSLFPAQRMSA